MPQAKISYRFAKGVVPWLEAQERIKRKPGINDDVSPHEKPILKRVDQISKWRKLALRVKG
jgi:hypothetical protein